MGRWIVRAAAVQHEDFVRKEAPEAAGHVDPFDWPDATREDMGKVNDFEKQKIDPAGKQKAKAPKSPESRTREHYRDLGYTYDRLESYEAHYGAPFPIKRDCYGILDAVAVGHGELLFLQSTTLGGKSAHITKLLTKKYRIGGNGLEVPIIDAVVELTKVPGVRILLCCWHQPTGFGGRWQLDETEVTPDLIQEWKKRRKLD